MEVCCLLHILSKSIPSQFTQFLQYMHGVVKIWFEFFWSLEKISLSEIFLVWDRLFPGAGIQLIWCSTEKGKIPKWSWKKKHIKKGEIEFNIILIKNKGWNDMFCAIIFYFRQQWNFLFLASCCCWLMLSYIFPIILDHAICATGCPYLHVKLQSRPTQHFFCWVTCSVLVNWCMAQAHYNQISGCYLSYKANVLHSNITLTTQLLEKIKFQCNLCK